MSPVLPGGAPAAVSVLDRLRRAPDVEAPNLHAVDATDRLLLDTAAPLLASGRRLAVLEDRYGALTLGAAAGHDRTGIGVHTDRLTAATALQRNAAACGLSHTFALHPLDRALLDGAELVLLQLPRSLDALDELAGAVARHAAPDVVVLAGGRVKHMSHGMTAVLSRHFAQVSAGLARQKSRVLTATGPRPGPTRWPQQQRHGDLTVCAHGATFAGTELDRGTRLLLQQLRPVPAYAAALDLGCGSGVLATALARARPQARVHALDESAAAVASARATAAANGVRLQVTQALEAGELADGSVDLVVCNPPFHSGATVAPQAAWPLFAQAARVLRPGGQLWAVWNSHLDHRPALRAMVGRTEQVARDRTFTVSRSTRGPS